MDRCLAAPGPDVSAPIIDDDDDDDDDNDGNDDEIEFVVIEDVEPDAAFIPEINETLRRQRRRLDGSRPSVSTADSGGQPRPFRPPPHPPQPQPQPQPPQPPQPPPQPQPQAPQPPRRRRWKERVRRFFGMDATDEDRPRSLVRAVAIVVVIAVCFIGLVVLL